MSDDVLEMLHTAPAPDMTVDPYAAMATGRRAQLRRRMLLGAAAATVVAMALGGLALTRDRTDDLPGGPQTVRATVHTESFGPATGAPTLEVAYDRATGAATFTLLKAGSRLPAGQVAVTDPTRGAFSVATVDNQVVVVSVLPRAAVAQGRPLMVPDGGPGSTFDGWTGQVDLPRTGLVAYLVTVGDAAAGHRLTALMWPDDARGAVTSDGSHVESVRFASSNAGGRIVFVDQTLGMVGLHQVRDRGWFGGALAIRQFDAAVPLLVDSGSGTTTGLPSGGTVSEATAYGVLPAGAKDVRVVTKAGPVLGLTVQSAPMPGADLTAIYVEWRGPDAGVGLESVLRGVSWQDSAGTRHTTALTVG